jgi:hypothetical protein
MGLKSFSIKVKSLHCWRPFTDRETPRSENYLLSQNPVRYLRATIRKPTHEDLLAKEILAGNRINLQ